MGEGVGKSLDIQVAILLSLWRPPTQDPEGMALASVEASTKCALDALRCLLCWLDPAMGEAIRNDEQLAERLAINTGNLLEVFAVSTIDAEHLVEPVAILVHSGATARGQFVLEALRNVPCDDDLCSRWNRLWTTVAAKELKRCLSNIQSADLEGATLSCLQELEDAALSGVAANVETALIDIALQFFSEDFGGLRHVFWDALVKECANAALIQQAPNYDWLMAWLEAGAGQSKEPWLQATMTSMIEEGDYSDTTKTPLSLLGRSCVEPEALVDAVALLVEYGDYAGFGDGSGDSMVISDALKKLPMGEPCRTRWQNSWRSAAATRLRWTLYNLNRRINSFEVVADDSDLEDAITVAQAAGLSGHDILEAERILQDSVADA